MTIHNLAKKEEIAKTVLLFGDPTQTHHLAHKYLLNVKKVSDVRFACFFTGEYKGKKYTFGSHGMGIGSSAIYIYELYKFYEVDRVIRVGSTGAFSRGLTKGDVVLVKESFTDNTTLADIYHEGKFEPILYPTESLHNKLKDSIQKLSYNIPEVRTFTTDIFYGKVSLEDMHKLSQADVVEMEAYVAFFYAKYFNKEAACLLTVVNCCYPVEGLPWLTLQEQVDARCPAVEVILNAGLE